MVKTGTEFNKIPVLILCGGRGLVLNREPLELRNKALIIVNEKPLVWWVMAQYALHGASEFVLATGLQSECFVNALLLAGALRDGDKLSIRFGVKHCHISLVETPVDSTTAARLLACKPLLGGAEYFAVTYSDTLSDVDLSAQMRFHRQHRMIGTLVGTRYPVRFRILGIRFGEATVRAFAQRPVIESTLINGGYYIFSSELWDPAYAMCQRVALEKEPLEKLALVGQLASFEHKGSWQHCDSERDLVELERLADQVKGLIISACVL